MRLQGLALPPLALPPLALPPPAASAHSSSLRAPPATAAFASATSMGSPQWTAPEVLRGAAYGALVDAYAYGVLLYEAMSRKVAARLELARPTAHRPVR